MGKLPLLGLLWGEFGGAVLSHIAHPQSGLGAVPMGIGVSAHRLWAPHIVPSTAAWGGAPTMTSPWDMWP